MDDLSISAAKKATQRIPLGMDSIDINEQHKFGQNIRLAMACIEGSTEPVNIKAIPSNAIDILQRLKALSKDITSSHADLIELLLRFDELEEIQRCQPLCCMDESRNGYQAIGLGVPSSWSITEVITYHYCIVDNDEQRIDEEFEQQRHADDISLFDFERDLRNDRESFETIRKMSPTRFGIRVMNAEGVDIRTLPNFSVEANQPVNNCFDQR